MTYCITVVVNFHRVSEKSIYLVNFTDHAGFKLKIRSAENQLPAVTYCYFLASRPYPLGIKKLAKCLLPKPGGQRSDPQKQYKSLRDTVVQASVILAYVMRDGNWRIIGSSWAS